MYYLDGQKPPLPIVNEHNRFVHQWPIDPSPYNISPSTLATQKCATDVAGEYTYVTMLSAQQFFLAERSQLKQMLNSTLIKYSPGVIVQFCNVYDTQPVRPINNLAGAPVLVQHSVPSVVPGRSALDLFGPRPCVGAAKQSCSAACRPCVAADSR